MQGSSLNAAQYQLIEPTNLSKMNLLSKLQEMLTGLFCHSEDEKSDAIEVVPEKEQEPQTVNDDSLRDEEPEEKQNEGLIDINAQTFTDSNGQVFQADKSSSKGSLLFKDANLLVYLGTDRIDLNNIFECSYHSRYHGGGEISYTNHTLHIESGNIVKNDYVNAMGPSHDDYVSYMEDDDQEYLTFFFKDGKSLNMYDYDYEVWEWLKELFCIKE